MLSCVCMCVCVLCGAGVYSGMCVDVWLYCMSSKNSCLRISGMCAMCRACIRDCVSYSMLAM